MKKYRILLIVSIFTLLISSGCSEKRDIMEKDSNPFFVEYQMKEPEIKTEAIESVIVDVTPPPNIVNIVGKEKIDIISISYPDFYANLNRTLSNYERGNLLDFVNIFLNTKIKDKYLFSEEIDKEIVANTSIEFLSTILSENQLIIETKISYIPILISALSQNESITNIEKDYYKYIDTASQSEYFTLTFDILKFSSSEGVKIKDYKYKDYIIRALTNTLYDSKKYILEYSEENNQEFFDEIVKVLRTKNYDDSEWLTQDIVKNLKENETFLDVILEHFTIKSINKDYYIITYPDIKNSIQNSNMEIEEIIELINNEEINLISKIVHDPDLNKLYNLIKNLMIV